jgi:hypothetical protein
MNHSFNIEDLVEVIDETSDFYQARLFVVHKEDKEGITIYGLSGNRKRRLCRIYEVEDKSDYDEALKMANSLCKRAQIDRIFHKDQLKLIKKAE